MIPPRRRKGPHPRADPVTPAGQHLQGRPPGADTRVWVTIRRHRPARPHGGPGPDSPHRSLIVLGSLLTTVAVAAGSLGVVESARAERTAALLANRYLVLQPPLRNARAAVANFQVLAAQAFGGAVSSSLLDAAVVDSADVDQTYLVVHRLLAQPENAGLAPRAGPLGGQLCLIVDRTGRHTDDGAGSAQSGQVAATEETADKNLDNAYASLEAEVSHLLVRTAGEVQADASDARNGLLLSLGLGIPFGITAITIAARQALRRGSAIWPGATPPRPGSPAATISRVGCSEHWRWPRPKSRSSIW